MKDPKNLILLIILLILTTLMFYIHPVNAQLITQEYDITNISTLNSEYYARLQCIDPEDILDNWELLIIKAPEDNLILTNIKSFLQNKNVILQYEDFNNGIGEDDQIIYWYLIVN